MSKEWRLNLKPCPFCGGEAELDHNGETGGEARYWIRCMATHCGIVGPLASTDFEAIKAWNTRKEVKE